MKIKYKEHRFNDESLSLLEKCQAIIESYQKDGYDLTVRQLYYQLVSKDIIANNMKQYRKVVNLIVNGRMAGLIDWHAIVDRTRSRRSNQHWESIAELLEAAGNSFYVDKWADQEYRPEVWIEKEALVGVISRISSKLDVPYFACKGYPSMSSVWKSSRYWKTQKRVIIYLGDHDPSGLDIDRDIAERLDTFERNDIEVYRIALTYDQIEEFDPPPNPAKLSDSRAQGYITQYGTSSWELDALEPRKLVSLVEEAVLSYRDDDAYQQTIAYEKEQRNLLKNLIASL